MPMNMTDKMCQILLIYYIHTYIHSYVYLYQRPILSFIDYLMISFYYISFFKAAWNFRPKFDYNEFYFIYECEKKLIMYVVESETMDSNINLLQIFYKKCEYYLRIKFFLLLCFTAKLWNTYIRMYGQHGG